MNLIYGIFCIIFGALCYMWPDIANDRAYVLFAMIFIYLAVLFIRKKDNE